MQLILSVITIYVACFAFIMHCCPMGRSLVIFRPALLILKIVKNVLCAVPRAVVSTKGIINTISVAPRSKPRIVKTDVSLLPSLNIPLAIPSAPPLSRSPSPPPVPRRVKKPNRTASIAKRLSFPGVRKSILKEPSPAPPRVINRVATAPAQPPQVETEEIIQLLPYAPGFPSISQITVPKGTVVRSSNVLTIDPLPEADADEDSPLPPHLTAVFPMYINGKKINALLDTGSSVSLIKESLVANLGLPEVSPASVSAKGITGHECELNGLTYGNIKIGKHKFRNQPFHVIKQCAYDCLVGLDIMSEFGYIMLNFQNKQLFLHSKPPRIREQVIPLRHLPGDPIEPSPEEEREENLYGSHHRYKGHA